MPEPVPPTPLDTDLTVREEQVVRLLARGYSNREVAAMLSITVRAVDTYRGRAMEKVGAATRMALVRYAARRGWLNPDAPDWV